MPARKTFPYIVERADRLRKRMTPAEKRLWWHIRAEKTGYKWRRQASLLTYIVDFYCPKLRLAIEVDGSSHIGKEEYDWRREQRLFNELGVYIIRFSNDDVLKNIGSVLRRIESAYLG